MLLENLQGKCKACFKTQPKSCGCHSRNFGVYIQEVIGGGIFFMIFKKYSKA